MVCHRAVVVALLTILVFKDFSSTCYDNYFSEFVTSGLAKSSLSTLHFVAIVTRHGSRSPLSTYPYDPYPYNNVIYWPNGPFQLTNLGKKQLYHTGQYIRSHYKDFIDSFYNPNVSEITYNPYNRDFISAACLAAGMYPPQSSQIWNSNLMWQPVVQRQRDFDICDLATNDMCPKYKKIFDHESAIFNKNSIKNEDLLKYVTNNTGKNFTMISQLYDIYDTTLMQVQNGYKAPEWTKHIFPDKLRTIAVQYLIDTYAGSKEQINLAAGPELKYISDRMTMKANGTNKMKKFYIEAAHDCTLLALLRALGNKDKYLEIQTGGFLLFELHYLFPDYIVQIFYYSTSYDRNPTTINIDGCPNPCSLDNFNSFVNRINPKNWNQACKI